MLMKMKDLCAQERPREKMLLCGAKSLSTAELLAILIGSGIGGKSPETKRPPLRIPKTGTAYLKRGKRCGIMASADT